MTPLPHELLTYRIGEHCGPRGVEVGSSNRFVTRDLDKTIDVVCDQLSDTDFVIESFKTFANERTIMITDPATGIQEQYEIEWRLGGTSINDPKVVAEAIMTLHRATREES